MLDTFIYYLRETIKMMRDELDRNLGKFVSTLPKFKTPITAVHLGMETAGEVIPKLPVSASSSPAGCLVTLLALFLLFIIVFFSILPALEKAPSPARAEALSDAARDPLNEDSIQGICDTPPLSLEVVEPKEVVAPKSEPPDSTTAPKAPKSTSLNQSQKSKSAAQGSSCDCKAPKVIWHDE